jgi:hypothetical protein
MDELVGPATAPWLARSFFASRDMWEVWGAWMGHIGSETAKRKLLCIRSISRYTATFLSKCKTFDSV